MATFSVSPDSIANGTIQQEDGNTVVSPDNLPIHDFLTSQGLDSSQATVVITISDEHIVDTEDLDGDGEPDAYVPNGTPLAGFEIDVYGDGSLVYTVLPQNPNQGTLSTNNQVSGNVSSFNGGFHIYDSDGLQVGELSGNLYLSSDGDFTAGENKVVAPQDNGGFVIDDLAVVCFTRGTWIETPAGPRRVEDLSVGDLITTLDHGPQAIRWIGSKRVVGAALARMPNLIPMRIAAGALGSGLPAADLVVSPQHRVLLSSGIARRMFGSEEVLVPAKKLASLPGVTQEAIGEVEYFHILMDRHEIVIANGTPTETLLTGPVALRSVGAEARREILALFPQLAVPGYSTQPARRIAEPGRAETLVKRHMKNERHLVAGSGFSGR